MDEKKEERKKEEECEKCAEYLNGWKRALADYDNLKKELARERLDMRRAAVDEMAAHFIPILDNFDQALKFKPDGLEGAAEGWLQGILHVRTQMEGVMQEIGIEPFAAVGEMFDPYLCDAACERASDEIPGTVLEVVQRGWKRAEHVLRPAKVIISK